MHTQDVEQSGGEKQLKNLYLGWKDFRVILEMQYF